VVDVAVGNAALLAKRKVGKVFSVYMSNNVRVVEGRRRDERGLELRPKGRSVSGS